MATLYFIIIATTSLVAVAFPREPIPYRSTIFGDEKLAGGPFANINDFDDKTHPFSLKENISPYRLPTSTKPEHYNILLMVEIPKNVFSGEVEIQLYATRPDVNEIVIHYGDLDITSVELKLGNTVIPSSFTLDPEYQFIRVRLRDSVLTYNGTSTNKIVYTLSVDFKAPLRTDMMGFYQSWFQNNATSDIRWMASTQFSMTFARFAFPCYDEPSLKATFSFTIRRPNDFSSWTGMRLKQTRSSSIVGYEEDEFYITPIQSTYVLGFMVAEFKSRQVSDENGNLLFEVIARPGAIDENQEEYAFKIGQDLLAEMSRETAIDFYDVHPHIKMTQAAIPDFSFGAMENWGLLTYKEATLMYDEQHSNSNYKQNIANILAHEIAHMWFGNLVSFDWWDTVWLKEGFARYYQYFLAEMVEPDFGFGIRFTTEQVHTVMLTDSADNPHPLTNPGVASPSEIRSMFSTLSYNKGASIMRQTEHLLGKSVQRNGFRRYLRERAFDTAKPIHLFQALQNEAIAAGAMSQYGPEFSVIDYYKTWTEQAGHPVLNVQVNHQTGEMKIYQRRFNINSGYSTATTNWIVPISFATASNPDFEDTKPSHIIKDAVTIINRNSTGDEWVIFNKQQTGYYRVNYDDYTWNLIVMALRGSSRTQIHVNNRAQIVNDVFQFARSGLMTYSRAFNILSYLVNETEYAPWVTAISGFNWIRNRLVGTTYRSRLDTLIAQWANTVMSQLTYEPLENESFMRSYLRYQLAPFLCNLKPTDCHQAALKQFQALLENGTEVPVDSRNWVYCNALRQGSEDHFEFLWNRYLNHNVNSEKLVILQALGCIPHEASLNKLLDAIVEDNYIIRPQDYISVFSNAVNGNEGNTQIVFRYIQRNLEAVGKAFGTHFSPVDYATPLSYITPRLRNLQQIQEFQKWATDNKEVFGASYNTIYNGSESTRQSLQWAIDVQSDIESYLNNGDETYFTTTSSPVTSVGPTTVLPPPLAEPLTPELPDAASTAFLSVLSIFLAVVANFTL
ncbi:hypothetical protein ABMA27_001070 [Loxostege sticticalis]|uniref:Aminopeptidase n=1 Tax=Loxostege sticticalis TaxID=481309 RepID=A0ABR3I1F3_LOXSC